MVTVQLYEERPIGISLPDHVTLTITEADPVVKGQTAASSYKPAMLENGIRVLVPPFIGVGRTHHRRHQRNHLRAPRGLMHVAESGRWSRMIRLTRRQEARWHAQHFSTSWSRPQ